MSETDPVEVEDPDLSDVTMVIINVETRDGHQYAFTLGPEGNHIMDVEVEEILDSSAHFVRGWNFHVTEREG